jgi:protein-disulfide isomerase
MHKGTYFALIGVAVVGGLALGRAFRKESSDAPAPGAQVAAQAPGGPARKKVPLDGDWKGAADAQVNIVVFSDFQCPFCGRVNPSLERLLKEYPGKVRVYFRHYPLPFHSDAPLASQAALAAGAQGKFWPMHDKLFANQQALKRPDLERYAGELGLDMGKFKQALDAGTFKARVDGDMALGGQVGVSGTPASFINGRAVEGAVPYDQFKTVVEEEIATTDKLLAKGTPKAKLYDTLLASAPREAPPPPPSAAPAPARAPVPTEVYKVALERAPLKGGKQPKVTIVEFSEFQCPFCSRALPTVTQILETYKDDVAVAWKHLPLPMHDRAGPAAEAAEAAGEQGKFWQMHDKMFANQQALDAASLDKYAQEIGLDMGRFKAALASGKFKERIAADSKQAAQFGVTGTPTFFVNGRKIVGASPFDEFKAVIDDEIKKADEKLQAGVARKDLYAALIAKGLEKVAPPPARPGEASPDTVFKAEVGNAPSKGPKDALVTIVQYSDFQCPFCSRVEPTMDKVMEEYKGKVRIVWRDYPLDFHDNAMPAAIVARVAKAENKFWPMHKKLFENQQTLDRASLEKYAAEVGLSASRVKAALDSKSYEADVKADMEAGQKLGVRGTPAFFINGTFLSGARAYEVFKERIDAQLAKAEALVAAGTPRAKVYAKILDGAQAAAPPPPPPPPAAGAPPEPDSDQTVYQIEVGKAPFRGPKNAPITLVVFSDFQCPFCSRVEPTIKRLEKEYPNKIKVVWKDYPLGFHNNARPAAIAARVAGEQGKFWQMHEKLFSNQTALDRPSLERYAAELGVNVDKLKAALDANKYSADIDADMAAGTKLGVSGTPASFINGRKIGGAYPYEVFKKVLDQELAKLKKRS